LEERTLVNAFVTWESAAGHLEFSLYGKNLTDEVYRNSANPVATLWNFTTYGPPREFGVQLGYAF
jgi:iron complex outermembrane receptor protein